MMVKPHWGPQEQARRGHAARALKKAKRNVNTSVALEALVQKNPILLAEVVLCPEAGARASQIEGTRENNWGRGRARRALKCSRVRISDSDSFVIAIRIFRG